MKHNDIQGTYHSVPQNLQSEEAGKPKKESNSESVIESEQNAKISRTPSKEDIVEDEKKPMSPLRKFCFVFSLLQCVVFIVAFGWLIPCKIPRHTDGHHYIQNWELNFYGEDFVTDIAVKSFNHNKPVAIILGFKSLSNESLFGIRAVNAFDGSSMWEVNTNSKTQNIVCSSSDANSNATPDCIVTSDVGEMIALSAKDGKTIWNMQEGEVTLDIQFISKPIMESTCHENNAPYIYAAVEDKLGRYHFVVVSSLSGRIEKTYELPECASMPENMMWRKSKVEHEEIDTPLELVMTCENKLSSGIIYTSNADEFCKNTSRPFNEIFFKLSIIDGARSPLRAGLLKTGEGDNIAVLTLDGRISIFSEDKEQETQFLVNKSVKIKDFVVGHFTNNSMVNIVVLTNSGSKNSDSLLLLDNTSSLSLRSIPVGNGTATSVFTVHNAFNSFDTVLLKLVTESDDYDIVEFNSTNRASDLKHFEVKYLILECFEMGTFRIVTENLISASCRDSNCKPDVFQERTAALVDVDNDGTEELIYFTRKMLPSMLVQSVTLQFKRLVEPLAKSCNTCHC